MFAMLSWHAVSVGICVKLRTFLVAMISLVLSILVGAAISHFNVYFLVLKIRFKTCINGLIYKKSFIVI